MEIKTPCSNSPLSELKKVKKHMTAKFLRTPCQTPPVNFTLTGGVKITKSPLTTLLASSSTFHWD
jgi:hypothetical protein